MLEWSIDGVIYTQCVECGKVIKIAPNRTRCPDCQKRHNREYMREYHKQRRKKFAKMGLCPWCGTELENNDFCPNENRHAHSWTGSLRLYRGLFWWDGNELITVKVHYAGYLWPCFRRNAAGECCEDAEILRQYSAGHLMCKSAAVAAEVALQPLECKNAQTA